MARPAKGFSTQERITCSANNEEMAAVLYFKSLSPEEKAKFIKLAYDGQVVPIIKATLTPDEQAVKDALAFDMQMQNAWDDWDDDE